MRLAWLFLTRSGRSNWSRLGLTAAAVALGMLMVLVFISGVNALQVKTQHTSWRNDIFNVYIGKLQKPIAGVTPLKAKIGTDGNLNKWQNEDITTVSLRAGSDTSPQLPGLPTPKDGEYYVSSGLAKVMQDHPEDNIGSRFGSKQIGIIPEALSTSPDALEVINGMSEQEASGNSIVNIYHFSDSTKTASQYRGVVGIVLIIGASLLLFPIVLFISIATQLGSAQREKRYAALRLIGATRRQVSRIIAVESLGAAVIGIIVGSLAYLVVLPAMSQFKLGGMRFWPSDLTVPLSYYAVAVIITLLFCLLANWWGMRRAQVSPLGVARSGKLGRRPRIWRLILLAPGLAIFISLSLGGTTNWLRNSDTAHSSSAGPLLLLMIGIFSIMFGLLLAGPWLTSSIARLMARRTHSAMTLLATKRIALQSSRIFRSVSGVVLALFAGSFYLTGTSGIAQLSTDAVANNGYSQLKDAVATVSGDVQHVLPAGFDTQLRQQSYVSSVTTSLATEDGGNLIDCQSLAVYTRLTCPNGSRPSDTVLLHFDASTVKSVEILKDKPATVNTNYLVKLNSNDNLDQLRSFVARNIGDSSAAFVVSGTYAQLPVLNPVIPELANLAYVGMGVTLFVAIASLIVSTIGGLLERRRSFVTLRLGGMTVAQMKRTVMIESIIPLISVSLLACGLGVWVGWVFVSAVSRSAKLTLTPLYFCIVIGSLLIATLAIRQILPMLGKITRPEENQTE